MKAATGRVGQLLAMSTEKAKHATKVRTRMGRLLEENFARRRAAEPKRRTRMGGGEKWPIVYLEQALGARTAL